MDLVSRVKNILLSPKTEWPVIAVEPTDLKGLFIGYVLPLAAIPAICGFIGNSLIGYSLLGVTIRVPIVSGLVAAVLGIALSAVAVYVVGFIMSKLAPQFGAVENLIGSIKVIAYSYTAYWVAGILMILPSLGTLTALAGLYGFYLFYLGATPVLGVPQDKAVVFTIVMVVVSVVVMGIIGVVLGSIIASAMMSGAMLQ
jgi:hypothetical protein